MNPFGDTALAVLDTTSMSEAATKRAFLSVVHRRNSDVADEIARTREDLTVRREAAEDAAARADASRQLIAGKLHELEAARAQQLQFEDRVQDRLEAALAEATSLQSQDATLAAAITRDQAALAAQLRTRSGARGQALPAIDIVNVARVRGIYVSASISDNLAALLAAADADGISLGGARLPQLQRSSSCPACQLRLEPICRLRDARLPVPAADREAWRVDARARTRDRLHLRGRRDRQSQQPRLQVAGGQRVPVRLL